MALGKPFVNFEKVYFIEIAEEARVFANDDGTETVDTDRETEKPLIQVSVSILEDSWGLKAFGSTIVKIPLDEKELKALQALPEMTEVHLVRSTNGVYTNRKTGVSNLTVNARGIEVVNPARSATAPIALPVQRTQA